jgi:hypothetical protein
MSTEQDYAVVSQVHTNQWQPATQTVVSGWDITVRDSVTGSVVPVFVADADYTVDNAKTAIEAALVPVRQVAELGSDATPA